MLSGRWCWATKPSERGPVAEPLFDLDRPIDVLSMAVGVIYAAVDRVWCALFIESDPINRQPEAPGSRTLRSIGWGALAGLVGGLCSCRLLLRLPA